MGFIVEQINEKGLICAGYDEGFRVLDVSSDPEKNVEFAVDTKQARMRWDDGIYEVEAVGHAKPMRQVKDKPEFSVFGGVRCVEISTLWQMAVRSRPALIVIHLSAGDTDKNESVRCVIRQLGILKLVAFLRETRIVVATDIHGAARRQLAGAVRLRGEVITVDSGHVGTPVAKRQIIWREIVRSQYGVNLDWGNKEVRYESSSWRIVRRGRRPR